ncbi:hypothetical protein V8D89_008769 [Ganoderma adspersum]
MFPPSPGHYPYRSFDNEHSQQCPTVNPRLLDLRTIPKEIPPAFQLPPTSLFVDPGEPGRSLSLLEPFENVLPIPFSPHPFHRASTGSRDEARQPSEPSGFYHSSPRANYSPHRISGSSFQGQSTVPLNENLYTYINSLPAQSPPDTIHPHRKAVYPTDATSWTDVDIVDIPQCLSPTSLPNSLPVDDSIPTDELEFVHYQTPPSTRSSSSTHASTSQMSFKSTLATDVAMELVRVSQPTTLFDPQILVENVTVLPQRRYQERQCSRMLSCVPQVIWLGPYGYRVSFVTAVQPSRKGQSFADLPNAKQRAFPDVDVGQKLSWRFLFDRSMEFERQFNVLDAKKTQPNVERIIFETVKALQYFQRQEPRFTYPLDRLVILEIELVSRASVQAKIGVLKDAGGAHQG